MNRYVLALTLLLAPAGVAAQQQRAAPPSPTPAAPAIVSPLELLVQQRKELELTSAQVQKLEAIRGKTAQRERDLIGKITAARGVAPGVPIRTQAATPEEWLALRQRMQSVWPQINELRQLHLAQMVEARGVLTPEQNARAWSGVAPCCGGPGWGPRMGRGWGRGWGAGRGWGGRGMRRGMGPGRGWGW